MKYILILIVILVVILWFTTFKFSEFEFFEGGNIGASESIFTPHGTQLLSPAVVNQVIRGEFK